MADEQFHSEDRSPWGPITMLYTMWHASAELEGYGQQGTMDSIFTLGAKAYEQMRIPFS